MATNISKSHVLNLYKSLLRESQKFSSYNFRMYALRKIRDTFKDNFKLMNPIDVSLKYSEGLKNLELIKRQVLIGQLYSAEKLVIENIESR